MTATELTNLLLPSGVLTTGGVIVALILVIRRLDSRLEKKEEVVLKLSTDAVAANEKSTAALNRLTDLLQARGRAES
jgi:hypothetical protein